MEDLQASGYPTEESEEVELEDLQGARGLKALRVPADMQDAGLEQHITPEDIAEAVQTMYQVAT
jgi:hypothetical protein